MRGAALLGGAASMSGVLGSQSGAAAATPEVATAAPHVLTSPPYFDLSRASRSSFQTSSELLGLRTAENHFQVQGLTIDSGSGTFFVAQAPNPDQPTLRMTVNGRSWSADPYNQHASGDLVISRLDLTTGELRDSMYVMGAGHGGQIAVEPGGSRPFLWLETYPSNPKTQGSSPHILSGQVFGSRLARLPYRPHRLVTNTQVVTSRYAAAPYVVMRRTPVAGARRYSVSIDASSAFSGSPNGVLVVRYHRHEDPTGAPLWFSAFDLDAARDGDFSTPLAATSEPTELSGAGPHSEGFATCGQYIYLVGTDADGLSSLYEVDLNGPPGSYRSKVELPGRGEPESVALYAPGGVPTQLYYLSASVTQPRTFDLYFLNAMTPVQSTP